MIKSLPFISAIASGQNSFFGFFGSECPTGSIKYMSALGLLGHLRNSVKNREFSIVYGSTSGNTGIAAAQICRESGKKFIAIVDHKLELEKAQKIISCGGDIVKVDGGVQERIQLARHLADSDPNGVDIDQYNNPGALLGHYQITGPMIWDAMRGKIDAVVIAIGTGGSFGGIAAYLTKQNPKLITVPVDAKGSMVIDGTSAHRYLSGIGCAFIPKNVVRAYNFIRSEPAVIGDEDAFHAARWFKNTEGHGVGGSGGAVIKAGLDLAKKTAGKRILLVFHDGDEAYQSTVYNNDWMASHNFSISTQQEDLC